MVTIARSVPGCRQLSWHRWHGLPTMGWLRMERERHDIHWIITNEADLTISIIIGSFTFPLLTNVITQFYTLIIIIVLSFLWLRLSAVQYILYNFYVTVTAAYCSYLVTSSTESSDTLSIRAAATACNVMYRSMQQYMMMYMYIHLNNKSSCYIQFMNTVEICMKTE